MIKKVDAFEFDGKPYLTERDARRAEFNSLWRGAQLSLPRIGSTEIKLAQGDGTPIDTAHFEHLAENLCSSVYPTALPAFLRALAYLAEHHETITGKPMMGGQEHHAPAQNLWEPPTLDFGQMAAPSVKDGIVCNGSISLNLEFGYVEILVLGGKVTTLSNQAANELRIALNRAFGFEKPVARELMDRSPRRRR